MSAFLDSLWAAGEPTFQRILDHPFLRGLQDGTLPEECFRHYVIQDAHYLRDFGRGLAIVGARCADDDDFILFCQHAANAIHVERALHEGFFTRWKLSRADLAATPIAPTCHHYTSHLLRTAGERPLHEALAAFLPCYWVYLEVGRHLVATGSPHPLYQTWINTYAGDAFATVVQQVLAVAERAAERLTAEQKAAMTAQFVTGVRLEWMFWDMGWRREHWPA